MIMTQEQRATMRRRQEEGISNSKKNKEQELEPTGTITKTNRKTFWTVLAFLLLLFLVLLNIS